jgi:hypothetical protein
LPCTSAMRPGHGSSTCPPAKSTIGMIWSARSWATSRARTCALEIPGTCAPAPRSPANRCGTSYGASPSAVQSSPAWRNLKSCTLPRRHHVPGPRARAGTQPARGLQ